MACAFEHPFGAGRMPGNDLVRHSIGTWSGSDQDARCAFTRRGRGLSAVSRPEWLRWRPMTSPASSGAATALSESTFHEVALAAARIKEDDGNLFTRHRDHRWDIEFIGGLGAVGAFLLKTAEFGLGVNLLAQSLAGKPKDPTFSINGTLQGGGDVARSFIMGRTATAGSLVFVNTWGQDGDTPNAYLTQVIALSDLPVRGLAEVWVNGELVTLGGLTDRGYSVNEYPDSLWVKFYDGTQTTADSFLFTSVSNGNRWWNPDRIGRGVAYAIVTARVSKNMFSGVPSFKFVLEGLRLYDISRDSTQGGVGPQRFADPATWGGDGDFLPALGWLNR